MSNSERIRLASFRRRPLISLAPLVDVMLILLVFFMVTSTYLDLDMIPVAGGGQAAAAPPRGDGDAAADAGHPAGALLIRLAADGRAFVRGEALGEAALADLLAARLAERPDSPVWILPSGRARTQALVTTMELARKAGATNLRVVRLEGRP